MNLLLKTLSTFNANLTTSCESPELGDKFTYTLEFPKTLKIYGPSSSLSSFAEFRAKKHSTTNHERPHQHVEKSWVFGCCMKCRTVDTAPAWEPPLWQKLCPYPFFPSYRQFANILALLLIGNKFLL